MTNLPAKREPADGNSRKIATASAVAAAGAVACGICCALPFALPATTLASSGSVLAWLGGAQGWMTALAALLVIAGWVWVLLRSRQTRRKPAQSTLVILAFATALFAAAVAWPSIERLIIGSLSRDT